MLGGGVPPSPRLSPADTPGIREAAGTKGSVEPRGGTPSEGSLPSAGITSPVPIAAGDTPD